MTNGNSPQTEVLAATPELVEANTSIAKSIVGGQLIPTDAWVPLALSLLVVVFGAMVLWFEYRLLSKNGGKDMLRVLGLTLILLLAFLSIPAGFGPEQIAPVMGLFGTVAGYLLAWNQGGSNK